MAPIPIDGVPWNSAPAFVITATGSIVVIFSLALIFGCACGWCKSRNRRKKEDDHQFSHGGSTAEADHMVPPPPQWMEGEAGDNSHSHRSRSEGHGLKSKKEGVSLREKSKSKSKSRSRSEKDRRGHAEPQSHKNRHTALSNGHGPLPVPVTHEPRAKPAERPPEWAVRMEREKSSHGAVPKHHDRQPQAQQLQKTMQDPPKLHHVLEKDTEAKKAAMAPMEKVRRRSPAVIVSSDEHMREQKAGENSMITKEDEKKPKSATNQWLLPAHTILQAPRSEKNTPENRTPTPTGIPSDTPTPTVALHENNVEFFLPPSLREMAKTRNSDEVTLKRGPMDSRKGRSGRSSTSRNLRSFTTIPESTK